MNVTPFDIAQRFIGVKEVSGPTANPMVLSMLRLDNTWPADDEVPWCSAFVNYVCWLLRLPRSKSLAARSWLDVGVPVSAYGGITQPQAGYDIVVLSRGADPHAGHVGFYAGMEPAGEPGRANVLLLGGNQGDSVSIAPFDASRIVGIRRLA